MYPVLCTTEAVTAGELPSEIRSVKKVLVVICDVRL